jgi:hypothetical protein
VIVTEWVDGRRFDDVKALPQEERNRFSEILYRFFVGSLYRHGHFSADPHPGNYMLMDDGRVAFIDFGMNKKLSRARVDQEVRWLRAVMERDADGLRDQLAALGYFDPGDAKVTGELLLEHAWAIGWWWLDDQGEVTVDRDLVAQMMANAADPRSEYLDLMSRETVPAHAIFAQRMVGLTFAVIGQLGATRNWHRVAREYLYDEPPATELGEQEESFWPERRRAA